MIYPPPTEMSLIGVLDAGVPNRERIVLRPMQLTDLAAFGILVGWKQPDGSAMPLWDQFYWFGRYQVSVPSWIFLYTGPGTHRSSLDPNTGQPLYEFYWSKKNTIFSSDDRLPILFKFGAVSVGTNATAPIKASPATLGTGTDAPPAPNLSDIFNKQRDSPTLLQDLLRIGGSNKAESPTFLEALTKGKKNKT